MKEALPVFMTLLFVMCVTGLMVIISLRKTLKREHPDIHARLHGSTLQIANDLSFSEFLLTGSYSKSVGPHLKKKMDALRVFVFIYLIVLLAVIAGFLTT